MKRVLRVVAPAVAWVGALSKEDWLVIISILITLLQIVLEYLERKKRELESK